jgi:formylglycine-generating enzyme required for sulfatase activity
MTTWHHGWRFSACVVGLLLVVSAPAADEPAARREKIVKLFVDELVPIKPGKDKFPASFKMGTDEKDAPPTEKPLVTIAFPQPFAMAKYEVTQELYEVVMGKNPSKWKGPRNSVEMVSWDEANQFCEKLTAELHDRKLLAKDQVIRLPSEAEWEYCCRAGTTTQYSFGDKVDDLGAHAWFKGNSKGEDPPVGRKKPNAWGLYDMHGYVWEWCAWEWCADDWRKNHEGAPADGSARRVKDAKERVVRGGSWADAAEMCRSAYRQGVASDKRSDTIGFRCVQTAAPKKEK